MSSTFIEMRQKYFLMEIVHEDLNNKYSDPQWILLKSIIAIFIPVYSLIIIIIK